MYDVKINISFPLTETTCASHRTLVNDNCDVISVVLIKKCTTWKHNQLNKLVVSEKKQVMFRKSLVTLPTCLFMNFILF